ncbi:E3 ubiquitin-protein ligase RSL1-like [Tasmannia lanceolata]|uniref:E3 ubiquitin-protein ligase RSL1-like n=1 Tax=Tasmannia lanceolata TaxID=3420 RepID=UPI004063C414
MDDDFQILVSEQQRELMAAKELESDLDFAFQIQMQEAMEASLSMNPHEPSSSSFEIEIEDDLIQVMKLQTLELEKFQLEKKDRDLCESEMKRISYNLKCQIHDGNLARQIHQMPDEEWEETGDYYEKPFGEASSSSGPVIDEPFRLYFKGLVTTENVKGEMVKLAGIGIAVCDPRDNLILQLQKPLVGGGMSHGIVETKALIEGLNAALSLDINIKRIDVFFEYVPLYNHVMGRWAVKQRKLENLVSQVNPLQRKFEACRIYLLPRCHIKFAFKLARDAIDSQITKAVEPTVDKNLKHTCTICLEDTDASQMFSVDGCLHSYCFSCMKQHVEVKLLQGIVPGCPHDGCNIKLKVDSCRKFLTPKLIDIMTQRINEALIPETDKLYCPYPKCSALMSKKEMILPQQDSSSLRLAGDQHWQRKCIKCKAFFCLNCKVPWHANMSCTDYKRFNPYPRAEDVKLQTLAMQKLWRQCVKCSHMIELAEGCYHMTCRCGYEFCYTCGAEWKDKKATCSCPLWDEHRIMYDQDEDEEHEDEFYDDDDYYDDEEDYESDDYAYYPRDHQGGHIIY